MSDLGAAVASMKQAAGLPTSGVNQGGDSPLPPTVNQPRQTVSEQNANVEEILKAANQKVSQAQQGDDSSELARAMAAKDKAINDLREQNEQLHQANLAKLESMEAILKQASEKPSQGDKPINIPGLPENIASLPADEALKAMTDTVQQMRDGITSELQARDEALKKVLTPLLGEVNQMKQIKERTEVMTRFPNFDLQKYEGEMAQLRAELPGMSALEAATIVGMKHDEKMLLSGESQAPVVMGQRPSMEAASGRTGQSSSSNEPSQEEMSSLIRDAIVKSHKSGNTAQANRLTEELLKMKVPFRL